MNQQDEEIIREEAKEFYRSPTSTLLYTGRVTESIYELRARLVDFYTPNAKSIFLDEVYTLAGKDLEEYTSKQNTRALMMQKFLFYVRQEIGILPSVIHTRAETNQDRTKVFISYSHADDSYLKEMQKHFKPFEKQVELWSDQKIQAGAKWKDEIRKALSETKTAIFLVSADFFASDFIMSDELPVLLKAAEEEGATILSIILKPCAFEHSPLSEYQAINSPDNPLLGMNELEKEQVYVNVLNQVLKNQKPTP